MIIAFDLSSALGVRWGRRHRKGLGGGIARPEETETLAGVVGHVSGEKTSVAQIARVRGLALNPWKRIGCGGWWPVLC